MKSAVEQREYSKKWRAEHPDYLAPSKIKNPHYARDYWRAHPQTEVQKQHRKDWNARHLEREPKNRSKVKRFAQNYALHNLPLEKECEFCGETENLHRHHPDYDFPEIIVTCCGSCHLFIHRGDD